MADQRQNELRQNDLRIKEILTKYGESLTGSVWRVQGTAVIYHKTLERIAVKAQITFDEPKVIRAERDEAVIQVTGRMGDRVEWTIGEALVGTNYRVSGKQAAYVWAMAEKRAKDRLILKLIELAGYVYSEEEADDFKKAGTRTQDQMGNDTTEHDEDGVVDDNPPETDASAVRGTTPSGSEAYSGASRVGQKPEDSVAAKVKANIDRRNEVDAILDFMNASNTVAAMKDRMTAEERKDVEDHARARLVGLGWVDPNAKPAEGPSSRKPDPYSKGELATLPNRISTAIANSRSVEQMEKDFDDVLIEGGLIWDKLPEDLQKKLNDIADKKAAWIQKNVK